MLNSAVKDLTMKRKSFKCSLTQVFRSALVKTSRRN